MTKAKLKYTAITLLAFLITNVGILSLDRFERNAFREQVLENRADCLKENDDNPKVRDICFNVATQSQDAYNSVIDASWTTQLLILTLIYGLLVGLISLKYQVDNLKERPDA